MDYERPLKFATKPVYPKYLCTNDAFICVRHLAVSHVEPIYIYYVDSKTCVCVTVLLALYVET